MSPPLKARYVPIGPQSLQYRAGDRLPSVLAQILDPHDEPYPLGNSRVFLSTRRIFGMAGASSEWGRGRQALILDPDLAIIYYDMQPEDTMVTPGVFELIAIIEEENGEVLTVPTQLRAELTVRDWSPVDTAEAYLRKKDDTILTTKDDKLLVINIHAMLGGPADDPVGLLAGT